MITPAGISRPAMLTIFTAIILATIKQAINTPVITTNAADRRGGPASRASRGPGASRHSCCPIYCSSYPHPSHKPKYKSDVSPGYTSPEALYMLRAGAAMTGYAREEDGGT